MSGKFVSFCVCKFSFGCVVESGVPKTGPKFD